MRIVYHHRTLADGAEGIHIREMVAALRGRGHEVRVVSLVGEEERRASPRRSRWQSISKAIPTSLYEAAELAYNVVGRRTLEIAIKEFRPDFVYDRYNCYCTVGVAAARRCGVPLLLEVNAPVAYERSVYERLPLKFPALALRYERSICTRADAVFAVSTPLRRHLIEQVGVLADRVVVLPNGANPQTFHPGIDGSRVRARYAVQDRVVIGFLGILRPWHGVDLLLEAAARLRPSWPQLHVLIVGDGPMEGELRTKTEVLGLTDAVTFAGRVSHSEVREHVAAMDIAVSPHATFYASPMKLLEYMALSRPVVAPDLANIRDIVAHGETGLLFDPGDVASLTRVLAGLFERPALGPTLGAAARRAVESRFNWDYNARVVVRTAEHLLSGRLPFDIPQGDTPWTHHP